MHFINVIGGWINRHFADEEAIFLVVLILVSFVVLFTLGGVLAPILTGLVFAFLLQGLVARLEALRIPRLLAICLVEIVFLGALIGLILGLLPLVGAQLEELVAATPRFFQQLGALAEELGTTYPDLFSQARIESWIATLSQQATDLGAAFVQTVVGQLSNVISVLIFIILLPIAVFFFLKDREKMATAFMRVLPKNRRLMTEVGNEMSIQIANYVRGKFFEIVIVGSVSFAVFSLLDVNYAALLSLITGISVLVPFVGAALVTLPIAIVGLLQHGWSVDFLYLIAAYAVIQALDGNVLVPLLFSEAVNLHPIAIIIAVLVFGGIWGFWGVFFAIPLATLVKAVISAWPSIESVEELDEAS